MHPGRSCPPEPRPPAAFAARRPWYVGPAGRLRPVCAPMDPSVQVLKPWLEVRLVVLPRHAIHARGGFALERIERQPESVDVDVVEERGEPLLFPLPCSSPYAAQ